ncbi:hypothetical protein EYF80_019543 [Liparis tanakae]|uniref:Uncharacterized protein n=1 Tax=Liparis tanakae TaxID=230148 RepID=A0A4Z2HWX7_9TELE|nr:hypothetical protein EYF80_019543 [Liparis tanakae]
MWRRRQKANQHVGASQSRSHSRRSRNFFRRVRGARQRGRRLTGDETTLGESHDETGGNQIRPPAARRRALATGTLPVIDGETASGHNNRTQENKRGEEEETESTKDGIWRRGYGNVDKQKGEAD